MKHVPKCVTLKPFHLLASLFAFSFLATGCGQQEASYYPLAHGLSWEYELSVKQMLGGGQTTMTLTNLPPRQLGDRDVVPQRMEAPGHSAFMFIAEDANGIFEHAYQEDGEPEIKDPPDYLLKYPIQVGASWEDAYKTEMLQQKIPVTIKSTIESVAETVTVPAGTFNNCVKVRGVGKAKKSMGLFGAAKIDVESITWMCPGVGVVKSLLEEDGHNLLLGGGKVSMQLVGMRKDGKPTSGQEGEFSFTNWFGGQSRTSPVAGTSAGGGEAKQYLDNLFDRLFLPEGMKYTLTELGTLGGKNSDVKAVSADGTVVVGMSELSNGSRHAFRWKGGVMTDLGALGGESSQATAVSADGAVVVGNVQIGDGIGKAFRWQDGVMTDLGTLGGESEAHAVSADGTVVIGMSSLRNGSRHAFRWKNGVMSDLGVDWEGSIAAVSVDGSAVLFTQGDEGIYRSSIWQNGAIKDLGTLGGETCEAGAVSADGAVVVGVSSLRNGSRRAFRWKDGVMSDLGDLNGMDTYAYAVSADGTQVVGLAMDSGGFKNIFRWKDGVMSDIGKLDEKTKGLWGVGVSADGMAVAGMLNNKAFLATAPQIAGMQISTARAIYYALLAAIALGLLIAFALAVRYAIRGRRAHRLVPVSTAQIFCSQCGSAQLPTATFCAKCGARLEK